jgi:hypothetical protein
MIRLSPNPLRFISKAGLLAVLLLAPGEASALDTLGPESTFRTAGPANPSVPPIRVYLTPGGGIYGRVLYGGSGLQVALANGWETGIHYAQGEEFCILCGHLPEKFLSGAASVGYRGVNRDGYASASIGPAWGRGKRPVPGAKPIPDSTCSMELLCWDKPPPMERYGGWGAQIQLQAAFSSRYVGIGAEMHLLILPNRTLAGVALIVPLGWVK